MSKRLLLIFVSTFFSSVSWCRTYHDTEGMNVKDFFVEKGATYVISYSHSFKDELYLPKNIILKFKGGTLSGPIVFNKTCLEGDVNLKGSIVSGSIKNNVFNASWLCFADGVTDDARNINDILSVCKYVYFPKGQYRLISEYTPSIADSLRQAIRTHIGISQNDITLKGEEGTEFITTQELGTICIYTQPYLIQKSVRNIKIQNIKFTVKNHGKSFHELRHTIKVIGVNGLAISDCFFDDFWGDAICLSHYSDNEKTGERTRNQNVKILNNTIIGGIAFNNRNGISVINGRNVLIRGNEIRNTSRRDMPGGIDIEPNNSAYTIENIKIDNNSFSGINGSGGAIGLVCFNNGPAHSIYITNNVIKKSLIGITIYIKTENTTDNIVIKGNTTDDCTHPYNFVGEGLSRDWQICNNNFGKPCKQEIPGDIRVKKLKLKNNKKKVL